MKEQINNNLTPGALAFNNPARMGLGETTTIQLVVESSVSGVEVAPSVTEPGIVITADIEVAATMQAILVGRGFEIAALTPEIQPLRGGAEWRWQITAVDSGRLELALTVNALIDVTEDGVSLNNAVVPIKVFEETIDVEVGVFPRVSGFFRSNFFWLGPFLLVPLAGIGWDRVRRRLK